MSVFIYLSLAPLLLLIAVIFRVHPPQGINSLYGYRTKRSMRSPAAWDFANGVSTKLLLVFTVLLNVIQLGAFYVLDLEQAVMFTSILMVIGLIAIIPLVEKKLKEAGYD